MFCPITEILILVRSLGRQLMHLCHNSPWYSKWFECLRHIGHIGFLFAPIVKHVSYFYSVLTSGLFWPSDHLFRKLPSRLGGNAPGTRGNSLRLCRLRSIRRVNIVKCLSDSSVGHDFFLKVEDLIPVLKCAALGKKLVAMGRGTWSTP